MQNGRISSGILDCLAHVSRFMHNNDLLIHSLSYIESVVASADVGWSLFHPTKV